MLNHTQLVANRHVSSSSTPTYHVQSCHGSEGDREFNFWCSSSNTTEPSANDCVRLQGSTSFESNHSTLIPKSHHCCSASHNSRSKAIAESRKELMQTLQDLPESTFELSFQYLVHQQQQALQPVQNEAFADEKIKNSVDEAHQDKKKGGEKKNSKPNQILPVRSMENENFLVKVLFPSSLDWKKKKAKAGNVSKLSPTPSFHNPTRQTGKEKRIKSSLTRDNRSDLKDYMDESTNNSRKRSSKSRYANSNISRGCWPFLFFSKTKKHGGSG